jgi:hypothetical protein
MHTRLRFVLAALAFALLAPLGCGGCGDKPKSTRWDDAAAATTAAPPASGSVSPAAPLSPPGALNRYFPADGVDGFKRVFTADKEGYAEAKLSKDGKDVATLSINDGIKPFAKAKFDEATEKVEGFPVAKFGENQTSALVKDRYQVKVTSQTLDHAARTKLLSKFDLKGM